MKKRKNQVFKINDKEITGNNTEKAKCYTGIGDKCRNEIACELFVIRENELRTLATATTK